MKKTRNTFEAFQEGKQIRREGLIRTYLEMLMKSRVKFAYLTGLAHMVAQYIAENENGHCNKATLLRNNRYKALLLNYMAIRLAGGTKSVNLRGIMPEQAKALLVSSQLDASNYKREAERLRSHIVLLESEAENPKLSFLNNRVEGDLSGKPDNTHLNYVRTCQALYAILQKMENIFSIDVEKRCILDQTRMRNNVIVAADIATPFFEWLEANRDIG